MFWLFISDTLQVLMSNGPTVSELCFYGCCHPCLFKLIQNVYNGCTTFCQNYRVGSLSTMYLIVWDTSNMPGLPNQKS